MSEVDSTPDGRTPLALAIKTITTHAFALASYAYVSNLLRRPTRSHLQAIRMLFFLFVPTLPLVELLLSAIRSLTQFVGNYEDSDEIHFQFYLSAALGHHAQLKQDDDGDKDTSDWNKNQHLLNVGSHCAEKHVLPFDWVWIGKIVAALFGVTQAIGTIIMWVRRMNEADALAFDHRNGAMGIASTICGLMCLITLAMRLQWRVSKSFETQQGQSGFWQGMEQKSQFVAEALMSMMLHLIIACIPNSDNRWLYSSVGAVAFLFGGRSGLGSVMFQGAQSIMLIVFVYIFRHEIGRRVGITNERYERFFGGKSLKRVKALVGLLLVLWIVMDIIWLLVVDIIQVVQEAKYRGRHGGYSGFWWQDPISDSLIVI
jgi:hypothetical protein